MLLLKSIFGADVPTNITFTALRLVMFCLSFVLEDWALHELIASRRQRRTAVMLVASSYVTWTWQVHTFSNAIETVLVLWSLVLVKRIERARAKVDRTFLAASVLAFLLVFGTFNRVTFPAFVAIPLVCLLPTLIRRPSLLLMMILVAASTAFLAVFVDTAFYSSSSATFLSIIRNPIITPFNSLRYNMQASNLALHGTHPWYQHFALNLPQLLGPAFVLLIFGFVRLNLELASALCGTVVLSCFSHQEARFLLPVVPLILSAINIPHRFTRTWIGAWMIFNLALGVLMGVFHQGGVVPAQIHIASQTNITQAFWWKTYSPPTWLLGDRAGSVQTIDLMGLDKMDVEGRVCRSADSNTVLLAPRSAAFLNQFIGNQADTDMMRLEEIWSYQAHLSLDDLDFDDAILPGLRRLVLQRGIVMWQVQCPKKVLGAAFPEPYTIQA